MSLLISTRAKFCIERSLLFNFMFLFCFSSVFSARAEWKIDLSRRMQEKRQEEVKGLFNEKSAEKNLEDDSDSPPADWVFSPLRNHDSAPLELVILNTENGFVPSVVRVREGVPYKIYVVNVNEKMKNVSFVMDSFSEYHATFFGQAKYFVLKPKKEGVYSFISPETAAQGKLVVYGSPNNGVQMRAPSSSRKKD